ncbi:MAG: hypothetical protein AAF799_06900 [Myxococcota bacterium]
MNTVSSLLAALALWLPTPFAQIDTNSEQDTIAATDDDAMASLVFEPRVSRVPYLTFVESTDDMQTDDQWALESTLNVQERGLLPCIDDHQFAETASPYSLSAANEDDDALWVALNTADADRELDSGRLAVVGTGRGGGTGSTEPIDEPMSAVDQCMDDCFGQRRALGYCIGTCYNEL